MRMIVEEEDVSPGGGCFDVTVLASVWVSCKVSVPGFLAN